MLSRRVLVLFIAISLMWRQAQAAPAPAPGKHFLIETEDGATGYKGNVFLSVKQTFNSQTIDRMVQYTYILYHCTVGDEGVIV